MKTRSIASAAARRAGRHHAGIEVSGYGELRVSEDLHNHSGRHVLRKQDRGAGVSQVVDADAANACFGDQLIDEAVQIARLDHRSDCRRRRPGRSRPTPGQARGFQQPDSRGDFGAASPRPQEAESCGATCSTLEDRRRGLSRVAAGRFTGRGVHHLRGRHRPNAGRAIRPSGAPGRRLRRTAHAGDDRPSRQGIGSPPQSTTAVPRRARPGTDSAAVRFAAPHSVIAPCRLIRGTSSRSRWERERARLHCQSVKSLVGWEATAMTSRCSGTTTISWPPNPPRRVRGTAAGSRF